MHKLKLEPTAALVMRWGKKAFCEEVVKRFVEHLDLTSANDLFEKCCTICNWYDEVILNRKFFVNNYINEHLAQTDKHHLVIILAAGKSPVSLEILLKNQSKIHKVIEVDIAGMEEKQELYDVHFPNFSDKIKCITADITSNTILMVLKDLLNQYYKDVPCIVLLEGISYYLTVEEIKGILTSFRSESKNNTLLMEYLLPETSIAPQNREIPLALFGEIQSYSGIDYITRLDSGQLTEMMNEVEGKLIKLSRMNEIEQLRVGANKYFRSDNDGWIECSVWRL